MAAPPMGLLDLDDDTLGLVAALVWDGSSSGGLLGTCRRARAVGAAALSLADLRWGQASLHKSSGGIPTVAQPVPAAAWEAAVLRFLRRATMLREVHLSGGPSGAPTDNQTAVWGRIGKAFRGHPLQSMVLDGAALAAVVARGATVPPLRRLSVLGGSSSACDESAAAIRAALTLLGPSLEVLNLIGHGLTPCPGLLVAAGGMPRLRQLAMTGFGFVWDSQSAAALATACPLLDCLKLVGGVKPGVGGSWMVCLGHLPHLKDLDWNHLPSKGEGTDVWMRELLLVLAGHRLNSLRLSSGNGRKADHKVPLAHCFQGAATLPTSLLLPLMPLTTADARDLMVDNRVARDVEDLELPALWLPPSWVAGIGPFPRLHSLSVILELRDVDPETLMPAPWAGLPALEALTVQLLWDGDVQWGTSAEMLQEPAPPSVWWLLASVATSPCRATLGTLHMLGHFYKSPFGVSSFEPLVALTALRSLETSVRALVDTDTLLTTIEAFTPPSQANDLFALFPHLSISVVA